MADNLRDSLGKWSETGKNAFSLLRDAVLFGLLLLLVACPALMNDRLERTGIVSVEGGGIRWERAVKKANQESLAAKTQVEQALQSTGETAATVERIAAANPQIAAQVAPIRQSLARTTKGLDATSNQLASAVVRQQELLAEASPEPTLIRGWVVGQFIGGVDGAVRRGGKARVTTAILNVRQQPSNSAAIVGVLPYDSVMNVEEVVEQGSLKWLRVTVPST